MPLLPVLALLLCTAVVGLYAARVRRHGRARPARLGPAPGSPLVPGWIVEAFYWALGAPGRVLARLGVAPDTLTYLSLGCSLASLPLVATGRLPLGAVAVLVGGALDALDGMVARARGRASPAGAVLDSYVDRLADAAPFAGLAVLYRASALTLLVPIAAMTASSLVSYARAKAESHRLELPSGLMRRHERIVYLALSLLLGPLVPAAGGVPWPITLAGLALIAVVALCASIVLVARTRAALSAREAQLDEPATPPSRHPARGVARS